MDERFENLHQNILFFCIAKEIAQVVEPQYFVYFIFKRTLDNFYPYLNTLCQKLLIELFKKTRKEVIQSYRKEAKLYLF